MDITRTPRDPLSPRGSAPQRVEARPGARPRRPPPRRGARGSARVAAGDRSPGRPSPGELAPPGARDRGRCSPGRRAGGAALRASRHSPFPGRPIPVPITSHKRNSATHRRAEAGMAVRGGRRAFPPPAVGPTPGARGRVRAGGVAVRGPGAPHPGLGGSGAAAALPAPPEVLPGARACGRVTQGPPHAGSYRRSREAPARSPLPSGAAAAAPSGLGYRTPLWYNRRQPRGGST